MGRKLNLLRRDSAPKSGSYSPEEVDRTLLELCRADVLELGVSKGEPNYRVTEKFANRLAACHGAIMSTGGYGKDAIGTVVLLAVVDWFKPIKSEDARRYTAVLSAILEPRGYYYVRET